MAKFFSADSFNGVDVSPKNGTDFTLEELQSFVGGYIEVLPLGETHLMVINEEGKLNGLPINVRATHLFRLAYETNDCIVGNALICKASEIK